MHGASSSVGTHQAEHAGYHAHIQRIAPYARLIHVLVEEEDDECRGRHEARRVAVEEGLVTAMVLVLEDREARAVAELVVVIFPQPTRRGQTGLVGERSLLQNRALFLHICPGHYWTRDK